MVKIWNPLASFDKQCAPSQAPTMEGSQYDHLTYDELHNLCKSRGYCKKDAKTVLKTRLEALDTVERNSPQAQSGNMDTSFSALGKRARSRSVSHILETPTQVSVGKRVRVEPAASSMAALSHQMAEGSDEAVNVRTVDECNWAERIVLQGTRAGRKDEGVGGLDDV